MPLSPPFDPTRAAPGKTKEQPFPGRTDGGPLSQSVEPPHTRYLSVPTPRRAKGSICGAPTRKSHTLSFSPFPFVHCMESLLRAKAKDLQDRNAEGRGDPRLGVSTTKKKSSLPLPDPGLFSEPGCFRFFRRGTSSPNLRV